MKHAETERKPYAKDIKRESKEERLVKRKRKQVYGIFIWIIKGKGNFEKKQM